MPFKDLATSDSVLLRQAPPADDKAARLALKRMQEVGIGIIVPAAELAKAPLENAIALIELKDAAKNGANMPDKAIRWV